MELFKALTKTDIVRVRYKGTGPALVALMAGEVQVLFAPAGSVARYVQGGKLRALAASSAQRSMLVPELPTIAEAGVAGYEAVSHYGFATARTPAALIATMSEATLRALQSADVKQRFLSAGVETLAAPGDRLESTIRADVARWGKLVRSANIRDD